MYEIKKFSLLRDYKDLYALYSKENRWSFGASESKLPKSKCIKLYVLKSICWGTENYILVDKLNRKMYGVIGINYKKSLIKNIISKLALIVFSLFISKEEKAGLYEYYYGTQEAYDGQPVSESEITILMVDKDMRNMGIGYNLVTFIENRLQAKKIKSVMVNTDDCCDYKFYEKLGYECVYKSEFREDMLFTYSKML